MTHAPARDAESRELYMNAKAWPFAEARRLLQRVTPAPPEKDHVVFETGYGPSGLPHIGTFGEVVRTTMVRQAFRRLSDVPTRLVAFSDDMDGLRKVPDNVPDRDMLALYAEERNAEGLVVRNGTPLTAVPDPFGTHESFAHHNNARLKAFLDRFGFDYEFVSATECYRGGRFDDVLRRVLAHHEEIRAVVAPTLGALRQKTYSPFLPIVRRPDARLGAERLQVLHHAVIREADPERGVAVFQELDLATGEPVGAPFEHPITGGHCKLQWRVDWAMRWAALGVDYEMSGKDLIDSVRLSGRICRLLGARPPEGFTYELFLDEKGEKISKSKGNGIAVEEWLRYAPQESLALFMYHQPRRAKRLYFDVIPKNVDDYLDGLRRFSRQSPAERLENPVWHIHDGDPPAADVPLGFSVLLNLASVCHSEDKAVLWGFISRYAPGATPETAPLLDTLVGHAVAYYRDFVKPAKRYRKPDALARAALADLADVLARLPADAEAEAIQNQIYEVGKRHPFPSLRDWFRTLYECLLGQSQGPRMGSFVALYGIAETEALIRRVLAGEDPGEDSGGVGARDSGDEPARRD